LQIHRTSLERVATTPLLARADLTQRHSPPPRPPHPRRKTTSHTL
jgi:hypothetical protein